jgi:hypothetical protein
MILSENRYPLFGIMLDKKTPPRRQGLTGEGKMGCGTAKAAVPLSHYIFVMSRSLVSGRKISPMTKLAAATMIGYHKPE